jgi:SRSO17 transposase
LAGVPDEVAFATKPGLALDLLAEAVAAGVGADYVTADEVYSSRAFRTGCRRLDLAYVTALPANRHVTTDDARKRTCAEAVRLVPAAAWARMRTPAATKGAKNYDWAMLAITADDTPTGTRADAQPWPHGHCVLLARRHRYTRTISFFRAWTPTPVPLADLVAVVCARWHVEEDFQLSKRTANLDSGQVRTWTSWHRWSTAALTAYACLVIAALRQHQATTGHDPPDLIPITCPELQHLLAATVLPAPRRDPDHVTRWSHWRRRHQATARRCHQTWNTYADQAA